MGSVLSVNVGVPRANPWKRVERTGIDKRPVDGPVHVAAPGPKGAGDVGLAGDHAYDVRHHGGADQAVYAYAREELDRWAAELGRDLPCGHVGENVTTSGVDVDGALIGERWRLGTDLVLEVTCPRIPCSTFEGWMGVRGWNRRFLAAARPGAYLRVLEPGPVQAGDELVVLSRPDHDITVALAFRAFTLEPELLARTAVATALPQDDLDLARAALPARQASGG